MKKKVASKTTSLENRPLGLERRLSHIDDSLRNNRMETIRLSNKIDKMDNTLIKVDDHLDRLENKIDAVVRVINDHHLKTLGRLDDLEQIHPGRTHTAI